MIDDSLYLGFDEGRPLTSREAALSVSTCKTFLSCPHKYYLQKVLGLEEPPSVAQVQGQAFHAGLEAYDAAAGDPVQAAVEAFRASLAEGWPRLEAPPAVRVNPQDPSQPKGKEERPVTLEELQEHGAELLTGVLSRLEEAAAPYTPLRVDRRTAATEVPLGKIAQERGRPHAVQELFDRRSGARRALPVALIGGVPLHGYVDRLAAWPDGSPFLVDHKAVGTVVPFWGEERRRFEPSYDPATDLQLDVYSVATGIPRVGFQYLPKFPQYVPPDGRLHPDWLPEPEWRTLERVDTELPMAWARDAEGYARWVLVWRPAPEDHPSHPQAYRGAALYARCARPLRLAAERITEGLILLGKGVAPELAFPPGRPRRIGRRACPYCAFAGEACRHPQSYRDLSERDRLEAEADARRAAREALCEEDPAIVERRRLWSADAWHTAPDGT